MRRFDDNDFLTSANVHTWIPGSIRRLKLLKLLRLRFWRTIFTII